jgi:hypothetical protein
MAYDSRRGRGVLFGGSNAAGSTLADTWEWTGSNWMLMAPFAAPPARGIHAMAFDSDRAVTVLVGGNSGPPASTIFDDTWEWDGTNWSSQATTSSASPTNFHALAYDSAHRQVVRFGGGPNFTDETWIYGLAGAQAGFGAGCTGTLGVPALAATAASRPVLGGAIAVEVTSVPLSAALMMMGFSNAASGSIALPLSLGPVGMPGCSLLVDPVATRLVLGVANAVTWNLSIPFAAALHGAEFYQQAIVPDPGANAAGLTVSNGARCRIGC